MPCLPEAPANQKRRQANEALAMTDEERAQLADGFERINAQRELLSAYIVRDLGQASADLSTIGLEGPAEQINKIAQEIATITGVTRG